ncbi:hypothetical protein [Polycladidibacter hongkongensis]|uniref:hypothetical protein n=1 Tax=Polycladidibacter hongkongensis TaxID=1647556 RepID=UPI00082C5B08|nr:hypothetical protein [Pseudovibrio hongkongensis]
MNELSDTWGIDDLGDRRPPIMGTEVSAVLKQQLSEAMQNSPLSRAEIAHQMSLYLGVKISEALLNQYAAPSAGDKQMSLPRLAAFIHATDAISLIRFLPSLFGYSIINEKQRALLERELLKERLKALESEIARADATYQGSGQ